MSCSGELKAQRRKRKIGEEEREKKEVMGKMEEGKR